MRQSTRTVIGGGGSGEGEPEITVALNWWYDIEPSGSGWVWLGLLRGGGEVPWADEEEWREEDDAVGV